MHAFIYACVNIVNAHPTILGQYLTKNDIEHPRLEYYISNRDDPFKQLAYPAGLNMTRDQAKMLVLKIMNGGNITAGQQRLMPDEIRAFENCRRDAGHSRKGV